MRGEAGRVARTSDTPLSIGLPNQQLGSVNLLLFIRKILWGGGGGERYFLPKLVSRDWESTQLMDTDSYLKLTPTASPFTLREYCA